MPRTAGFYLREMKDVYKRQVLLSGILPPPDDNDLIILGFRAGNASVVKRGQEFAEGQIASAAKNSKGLAHSVFLHS